jgi:hypothetical protein
MDSTSAANDSPLHGVILGPLRELYADRIVIADRILFLRDGERCLHVVGVILEVQYTTARFAATRPDRLSKRSSLRRTDAGR